MGRFAGENREPHAREIERTGNPRPFGDFSSILPFLPHSAAVIEKTRQRDNERGKIARIAFLVAKQRSRWVLAPRHSDVPRLFRGTFASLPWPGSPVPSNSNERYRMVLLLRIGRQERCYRLLLILGLLLLLLLLLLLSTSTRRGSQRDRCATGR